MTALAARVIDFPLNDSQEEVPDFCSPFRPRVRPAEETQSGPVEPPADLRLVSKEISEATVEVIVALSGTTVRVLGVPEDSCFAPFHGLGLDFPSGGTTDQTVDEFILEHGLTEILDQCRALALEVLGEQAYLELRLMKDSDSERPELVVEAHFPVEDDEDHIQEMIELDQNLLQRYLREVPVNARRRILFTSSPENADPT